MVTAASSCITKAEEHLRDMLCNCTEFQTWTGAADATAAQAYCHYHVLPRDDENADTTPLAYNVSIRPFALISTVSGRFIVNDLLRPSGTVRLWFEQNTADAATTDREEATRLFLNTVGKILLSGDNANPGLWELSNGRQYMHLTSMDVQNIFHAADEDKVTLGDFQACEVYVGWGVTR